MTPSLTTQLLGLFARKTPTNMNPGKITAKVIFHLLFFHS